MICDRAVDIRIKNFVYRINQAPAVGGHGSDIIAAPPDFLGRNPPAHPEIAENGGSILLRRAPAAHLLPDILRLDGIPAVLQIQNQTAPRIRFIKDRNFL